MCRRSRFAALGSPLSVRLSRFAALAPRQWCRGTEAAAAVVAGVVFRALAAARAGPDAGRRAGGRRSASTAGGSMTQAPRMTLSGIVLDSPDANALADF